MIEITTGTLNIPAINHRYVGNISSVNVSNSLDVNEEYFSIRYLQYHLAMSAGSVNLQVLYELFTCFVKHVFT